MDTHPDFISFDPEIKGVYDMTMYALRHQNTFVRKTTPEERDQYGDYYDFQQIRLNLNKIDRFYFRNIYTHTLKGRLHRMFARMEYDKERHLFVYLEAHTPGLSGCFNDPGSGGEIYISSQPHRFINLMTDSVYESLKKDGYEFEWKDYGPIEWTTPQLPVIIPEKAEELKKYRQYQGEWGSAAYW